MIKFYAIKKMLYLCIDKGKGRINVTENQML